MYFRGYLWGAKYIGYYLKPSYGYYYIITLLNERHLVMSYDFAAVSLIRLLEMTIAYY